MHVSIENIMSAGEAKEKLLDLLKQLDQKNFYLLTQNDKPVAALVSVPHLMALEHENIDDLKIDQALSGTVKPMLPSAPGALDEKELPAPASVASLPPKPAAPLPPPPLPPLPPKPLTPPPPTNFNDKGPLVTDSEVKQVVNGTMPSALPKPAMGQGMSDLPDAPPSPAKPAPPAPPVPSPFGNVSTAAINPAPSMVPASSSGTSSPATWPTNPTAATPAPSTDASAALTPAAPKDDLDDLEAEDEIL